MGHSVLSTWLEEQLRPAGMTQEQFDIKMAMKDLQEIAACDCFILDLESPSKTMGKMVEYGFATAKYKLCYVIGERPKAAIFLTLADNHFDSWDDLFKYFEENHK